MTELANSANPAASDTGTSPLPGFTVVMPSYNQGQFIDHALTSILDQNYPDLEILVMDGGSTDDTVERLKRYGDKIQWVSQKDGGQTDALIKGFAKATKPWLTWLNSDDFQLNNALHLVAAAIRANPAAEVIMGNGHYANPDGTFLRPYPRVQCGLGVNMPEEFFNGGYVAQPSVYFCKNAYQKVGGLNPHKNLCMDYDLWTRLAVAGCRFTAIDEDISGNRWYEDTKTAQQLSKLHNEVIDTQWQCFDKISPYFVQATSDYKGSVLLLKRVAKHAASGIPPDKIKPSIFQGDSPLMLWLLFKIAAIRLLWRRPGYLLSMLTQKKFKYFGPLGTPMGLVDILRKLRSERK